jgi:ABC-type phosphate transport system substrate-binding protein
MFHKFESDARFPLAATVSLSAVMAVMVAVAPSAQAQVQPTVSADPTAQAAFTFPANSVQYFGAGATFPLLLNRQYFDFYGVAIPTISSQPGSTGIQPISPAGSPRLGVAQFNYCGTGSGNGRGIFTLNTTSTGSTCTYTQSSTGAIVPTTSPNSFPAGTTAGVAFPTNTSVALGGAAPLFAGTDQELALGDLNSYLANKKNASPTRGNPIQVPTVFGGIAAAYNRGLTGLPTTGVNLSTRDLCGIFDGSITNYSQLSTTSTALPAAGPIAVIIRSDNSGTTNGFTSYLAAACPLANGTGAPYYITVGLNAFPTGVTQTANFVRVAGNNGVTNSIATTTGGFGYIEASFTSPFSGTAPNGSPSPFAARVQNPNFAPASLNPAVNTGYVGPTQNAVRAAVPLTGGTITYTPDANAVSLGLGNCVLNANGLPSSPTPVLTTSTTAYPIISPTYTLAFTNYPTPQEAAAVRGLYSGYILLNRATPVIGNNDQQAQTLGFVLPPNGLRGQARACINTIVSP